MKISHASLSSFVFTVILTLEVTIWPTIEATQSTYIGDEEYEEEYSVARAQEYTPQIVPWLHHLHLESHQARHRCRD